MLALSKFNLINKSGLQQDFDNLAKVNFLMYTEGMKRVKNKTKKPAVIIKLL